MHSLMVTEDENDE